MAGSIIIVSKVRVTGEAVGFSDGNSSRSPGNRSCTGLSRLSSDVLGKGLFWKA